jgi:gentisate 1,2-dioxygenase
MTVDMADLPVQHPATPTSDAARRARFFNSGNAFNVKLPAVPARRFDAVLDAALAAPDITAILDCDQSEALGCAFPATTPLMLARYVTISGGDTLNPDFNAAGTIWYVLRGNGIVQAGRDDFAWSEGDVLLLPGQGAMLQAGTDALLWAVDNAPLLALDTAKPATPARAVHYPAAEIARQLDILAGTATNAATSGLALIFSGYGLEETRNILPSLTLSLNTLPPGEAQRAHRHNSAAVTLIVQGQDCHSTVDGEIRAWRQWSTLVTPPGSPHSHHNAGDQGARFLIVQDGGLHYHARTMDFTFLESA